MRGAAAIFIMIGLATIPLGAQGRGRAGDRSQGIPPGHMPPPGECRVWYDGRPPGQQPPPVSCREAERIASRSGAARVIYGDDRGGRDTGRWNDRADRRGSAGPRTNRDDDRRNPDRPRAIPRRNPGSAGVSGYTRVSFDNGYRDGYDKGREDGGENRTYDLERHSRYRSADRGYERRYGSKEEYEATYRDGFSAGYADGYREIGGERNDSRRRSGIRLPWPF